MSVPLTVTCVGRVLIICLVLCSVMLTNLMLFVLVLRLCLGMFEKLVTFVVS